VLSALYLVLGSHRNVACLYFVLFSRGRAEEDDLIYNFHFTIFNSHLPSHILLPLLNDPALRRATRRRTVNCCRCRAFALK